MMVSKVFLDMKLSNTEGEKHEELYYLELNAAKDYCKRHKQEIASLLDLYENQLFEKAIKNF